MRKTLTWKKENSFIENLAFSQTDSDSDYKPNSSIKRSTSFMKNSFDISSKELKDKLELCINSPRKFKSTYTLTAMSTPSSATDVDTATRREKIKLSSIPKMVSDLDDSTRPSTPCNAKDNYVPKESVQLNTTDQGFETGSNETPIKRPAVATSTPLRPDFDGSYSVTRRRSKEQEKNGSPRMGKSMFWISCKGQKMEFEVAYNSEERLKYILDCFIEKKAMTGAEITFGIDNFCFKNYQLQNGADKNSSFSEYWIGEAGEDNRFKFRGQHIPKDRILKVFELFSNTSSTVCFGVDSVDFFSVINMVDYSSQKFSIDSNYSMLIGCSPGGGWPRQYRPASMASKTSDLASEFESELDMCPSYIEAFDRLSIGSNLDNPLVSGNNTLTVDAMNLKSLNSSLIGMKDAMDEAITQWTNIHEGFKEFVEEREVNFSVENPNTPEVIKKINRISKDITDLISNDCDYNDFSRTELEGFADFLGKNLRATMQPYMKNMSDIMDVLLNKTLECEEVTEC